MFEHLRQYDAIVVTGMQRSGTTLAARIIAHDTGHIYVDEDDYGTKDVGMWVSLVTEQSWGHVIHSPAMSRYLERVSGYEDVFVVWVTRPCEEVARSAERIGWNPAEEGAKYGLSGSITTGQVCEEKRRYWRCCQRTLFGRNYTEVAYEAFKAHPLWVEAEARRHAQEAGRWHTRTYVLE